MLIKSCFEHYGRENFRQFYPGGVDAFGLSDTLYDLFLVPAVYYYHKNNIKNPFLDYLPYFLKNKATETNSYKLLVAHLKLLQKKQEWWKKQAGVGQFEGLGDVHECVYKIKSENKVLYENVLDIETLIMELKSVLPWTGNFLPSFKVNRDYIARIYKKAGDENIAPKDYYTNFGKVLAFCLYFRIIDIHMENVLATKSSPLLFDIEFMMTPDISYFPFDIKITGLLSGQTNNNNTALLGGLYDVNSYLKPVLVDTGPYNPKITWIVKSKGKWNNLPKNARHPYEFIDFIIEGYQLATADLITNTTRIATMVKFVDFKTRILARTTRLYRFLNLSYTFPQVRSQNPYSFFYKRLLETHTSGFFKPNIKILAESEAEQLAKFSIPYFMVGVQDNKVTDYKGNCVGTLAETPYENWLFHTKVFPTFATRQKTQIVRILKNNYSKYLQVNKSP